MRRYLLLLALASMPAWLGGCASGRPKPPERPIVFREASGSTTNEFQLHDSLLVELRGLTPRAGYELAIVNEAGEVVVANKLSTDAEGRIPETVLWYAIGSQPCWRGGIPAVTEAPFAYSRVTDVALAGRAYTLRVSRAGEAVRSASFRVARQPLRPTLYAADARGCPKTGFLIGEEDVWVVGRNFPAGSLLRLWTVSDSSQWPDGSPLSDRTNQYGYDLPPLIELAPSETNFKRLLWPRMLTSIGSYDMVAETVTYPFGAYRDAPRAKVQDVVAHRSFSAFVVQRQSCSIETSESCSASRSSICVFANWWPRRVIRSCARDIERHIAAISVYDAAYVAAARGWDSQLVSCDVRDLVSRGLACLPGDAPSGRVGSG